MPLLEITDLSIELPSARGRTVRVVDSASWANPAQARA